MYTLLTEEEAAKRLHVSLASIRRWRVERRGPQFIKVGSLVRYRPEDLESWLASLPTGGSRPVQTETASVSTHWKPVTSMLDRICQAEHRSPPNLIARHHGEERN